MNVLRQIRIRAKQGRGEGASLDRPCSLRRKWPSLAVVVDSYDGYWAEISGSVAVA